MTAVDPLLREKVTASASSMMPHILSLASSLIWIPSANPPGDRYARCIEILDQSLRDLGLAPTVVSVPGSEEYPRYALLADYGSGSKVLHFHAHYDVVPAARPDQYEPRVVDGRLYGRGSSDMKGAIAAMVMALRVLEECGVRLNGRIRVSSKVVEKLGVPLDN